MSVLAINRAFRRPIAQNLVNTSLFSRFFLKNLDFFLYDGNNGAMKIFSLKCVLSDSLVRQARYRVTHAYGFLTFPKILGFELVLIISLEVEFS